MILVTTGTNAPAFDRLLQYVDRIGNGEPLVVQHGPSTLRPRGAICIDYVSFDEFIEYVRDARVVVTHAGVGSILVALMNGKKPLVVPRLARFGEHVDDHQLELGRRLSQIGVITLIEDPASLADELRVDAVPPHVSAGHQPGELVSDLRAYLQAVVNGR